MAIATLTIDLVAKLAELQTGFDRATQMVQANAARMQNAVRKIGLAAGGLTAGLTPAALVAGLGRLIEGIDELDKAAQRLGLSGAVEFSGMRRAALDAGAGVEEFESSITRLNVKVSEAAEGNREAAALFKALGIETRTSSGAVRDSGAVLRDIADVFSKLADGPAKAALAVDLFGKSGARLIPLLNGGSQGLERFTGLTAETVEAAKALQQQVERFQGSVEQAKNAVAGGILPGMNDWLESINRVVPRLEAMTIAQAAWQFATGGIQRQIAREKELLDQRNEALKLGAGAYSNEGRAAQQAAQGEAQALRERAAAIAEAAKQAEAARKKGEQFLETLRKRASTIGLSESAVLRLEAAQLGVGKAAEKYVLQLERARELEEELAEFDRATGRFERERAASAEFLRNLQERVQALAFEADLIGRTESEQRKLTAAREIDAQVLERVRSLSDPVEIARAFDEGENAKRQASMRIDEALAKSSAAALEGLLADIELETAAVGRSNAERQRMILLRDLERQGIDANSEAYARAVEKIDAITAALSRQEQMQLANQRLDEVASSVARITGEFAKTGNVKQFFDNLGQYLLDLTTQLLIVEPLARALKGALSGGSTGSVAGDLLGSIGSWIGGARAAGGPVAGGVPYLVGEKGAEIFVPKSSGTIVPNHKVGGVTNNVTVNLPPNVAGGAATANQVAAEVTRRLAVANRRFN